MTAADQAAICGALTGPPPTKIFIGEAFGVHGSTVGEDGDWVLLGHVEPRKAIAVMWRLSRRELGLDREDIFGYRTSPDSDALLRCVLHRWAVFTSHEEYEWTCWWGATEDTPHAVPVTIVRPELAAPVTVVVL